MSKVDWSKAPEWATCVVKPSCDKFSTDYFWSEKPIAYARMIKIETCVEHIMNVPVFWEIVEERPVVAIPVQTKLLMTPKAGVNTYEEFIANGWDDDQLVENGYAKPITDIDYKIENKGYTVDENAIHLFNDDRFQNDLQRSSMCKLKPATNCRCTFTPVEQPSTAPDLLNQAATLLNERGQQYDKDGEERSAAKIVDAFNTITGRDLTPGEGWLFLVLLKAVRFYSNTETPHRDSLEDMIAYVALHAEEYLNDK